MSVTWCTPSPHFYNTKTAVHQPFLHSFFLSDTTISYSHRRTM